MNWKRKCRCPECRSKLKDFGVDLDSQKIECVRCHTQFSPLQVYRNSEIVLLSECLPHDKQEAFLSGLGFERQPVRRTPKLLLYSFFSFIIVGGVVFGIILLITGHFITFLSPIIGSVLLCLGIYDSYKDEEKPRWRRRKGPEKSTSNNT